jgi:hypothetical protein
MTQRKKQPMQDDKQNDNMDEPVPSQIELFEGFKKYNVAYPSEPYKYGHSPGHWFQRRIRQAFAEVIKTLPEDAIYLELGSFLGSGSTVTALEHSATLRAYCVDLFQMPGRIAAKHNPIGSVKDKVLCDYLLGKGNHLQHFLNNTWNYQSRIAPIQRQINAGFLHQLFVTGVKPDFIFVDDDHQHKPVLSRLRSIAKYWPEAIVLLDDHTQQWDGVRTGVKAAFDEGLYRKADSELLANRLMLLKRSAPVEC